MSARGLIVVMGLLLAGAPALAQNEVRVDASGHPLAGETIGGVEPGAIRAALREGNMSRATELVNGLYSAARSGSWRVVEPGGATYPLEVSCTDGPRPDLMHMLRNGVVMRLALDARHDAGLRERLVAFEKLVSALPERAPATLESSRWARAPGAVRERLADRARLRERLRTAAGRAGNVAGGAARMFADPRFAGAMVLTDLANAAVEGDPDRARDSVGALGTPEFWLGIGAFNATLRAGDAALTPAARVLSARVAGPGLAARATRAAGGYLKHNLVLAGALTVPRLVQVDLAGFTFSDAVRGDFEDLKHARVRFSKDVDGGGLLLTLASFSVAQPVYATIKRGVAIVGRRIAARLLRTAAVKGALALAPVPGTRVAAALLTVGEVAWGAIDLAGLLLTAHAIEAPVRALRDAHRSQRGVREAALALLAAGDRLDDAAFGRAMAATARAFGEHRDFLYLPAAIADVEFVDRLGRAGESRETLGRLANSIMDDYGLWLALPGQSAVLLDEYEARAKAVGPVDLPGGEAFRGLFARHQAKLREAVSDVVDAPRVSPEELDPSQEGFRVSRNRLQVYDQELALYRAILERSAAPARVERLRSEIETVLALKEVEERLMKKLLQPLALEVPGTVRSAMNGSLGVLGALNPLNDH